MSGLYIHIPFCKKRCDYCDFYSTIQTDRIDAYLTAIEKEMSFYASDWRTHTLHTIFIGGGTPSLLSPSQLKKLFQPIRSHFQVSPDAEITLEANPGTLSDEKLYHLLTLGVNRLSLGAQSFNDDELMKLGRIYTADEVKRSLFKARSIGFNHIGLDLIFGLPGQSLDDWQRTVFLCLDLEPEHISAYALTWNGNTPLGRRIIDGELAEPDESQVSDMFLWMHDTLSSCNYEHYEISNYAKPGYRCAHNWNYWNGTPYLGLGASAHSFDQNQRWWNVSDIDRFIHAVNCGESPIEEREYLSDEQKQLEYISLGLRTSEGIGMGCIDHPAESTQYYIDTALAVIENDRFILTSKGMLLADDIAGRLG